MRSGSLYRSDSTLISLSIGSEFVDGPIHRAFGKGRLDLEVRIQLVAKK
jgi:hypothetical protein